MTNAEWISRLRKAKVLYYHNRHVVEAEKKMAEIEQAIAWVKEQKS